MTSPRSNKTGRGASKLVTARETVAGRVIGHEDVERFRKFAATHTKTVTRSRAAARAELHKAGILTQGGRLSAKYK